ncbi:MAG: hypothetical protein ABI640_19230 [Gammaproteobacteria bacterium]
MQSKFVVYGFAAVWLVLFATSFVVVRAVAPEDDDFARRLTRIATFLTWQLSALVVAAISGFFTQRAVARGTEGLRLFGYAPLALSAFVLIAFIGIVGYRVWLQPLLAAQFGLV